MKLAIVCVGLAGVSLLTFAATFGLAGFLIGLAAAQ
jgi:hypothetical protein